MIEGTSTPFGQLWAANVSRKLEPFDPAQGERGKWGSEALVFSTNFRTGFDVAEFQTILPKNLIHRVVPGEPIYDFFEAWKRSASETVHARTWGARQWFIATAERLAARGYEVDLQRKWLAKGWLIWQKPVQGQAAACPCRIYP